MMTELPPIKMREIVLLDIAKICGVEFSKYLFNSDTCLTHQLLEYCRPEVDDLPGSDEDEDQDKYIAHLEDFEANIMVACE